MLEDIERIRVFLAGHDRNSFAKDEKTHFAVSYACVAALASATWVLVRGWRKCTSGL